MVITCPSCSARYRLNPDKIKGRGAKITCPKCSHVFVVFADATTSSDGTPAVPPPPAAPRQPTPPPSAPPAAQHNSETTSGAFQAVGFGEDEVTSSTTGNIRVVAPGPRKTRRVRALSRDNIPTTKQIGGGPEEAEAEEPAEPAFVEPRSAADLDFRSVGITTWKVKVSIGLIYDFSDISTLKKYLADKKVTEDDLISHNAKEWTRIGEIPDLDQHFIETWKIAKAAGASAAPKKERKTDPAGTGSHSTTGTSSGTYGAQPGRATGSHRTTGSQPSRPPAARKSRKAKPAEPEPSNRGKYIAAAAVLLLLLGGGWMYSQSQKVEEPVAGADTATTTTPKNQASQQERIQKAIQEKLARERAEIMARQDEEDDEDEIEPEEVPIADRSGLIAVRQDEPTGSSARGSKGRTLQKIQKLPKRTATKRQTTPSPSGSSGAQSTTKEATYLKWLQVAKKKLQEGNNGSALKAANNAVNSDPTCGECYETRAEIKQKMGDPAGAAEDLAKAGRLGSGSARAGQ